MGFDISCKLSPRKTICMKCKPSFGEKQEKYCQFVSAEFAHSVITVKTLSSNPSFSNDNMA